MFESRARNVHSERPTHAGQAARRSARSFLHTVTESTRPPQPTISWVCPIRAIAVDRHDGNVRARGGCAKLRGAATAGHIQGAILVSNY
jgi:hypothetical protein